MDVKVANYPSGDVPNEPIEVEFVRNRNSLQVEQHLYCQPVVAITGITDLPDSTSAAVSHGLTEEAKFSAGATTWNQKEGVSQRVSFHKQFVRLPLKPFQNEVAGLLVNQLERKLPSSIHTANAFAKALAAEWNEPHTRDLMHNRLGYGGLMSSDTAKYIAEKLAFGALWMIPQGHVLPLCQIH